ncbi:PP2C family serine/threonine-protein phosphatase [Emticicia sp. TH156]|uniref:PP2C family protein-serine/threonine phosphatase n=1 Tax=Emticicia sp. TH156 TaxID=2067454 RepID=UPI000C7912CD|nr:protein phosphatase 2C domain-containing protein [Emticicia sp. TH156]PLK44978.1 hypothetical protein C0V77_06955 [Emticicia sp. TH156]
MTKIISVSGIGKRAENQDVVWHKNLNKHTTFALVVDGMGGYSKGALAARIAVEKFKESINENMDKQNIQEILNSINRDFRNIKEQTGENLGVTLAGSLLKENNILMFWVGDVKIYVFDQNKITFESEPHSLMNELLAKGSITNILQAAKYRQIVTRSIKGNSKEVEPEFKLLKIEDGSTILICTDGVHELIDLNRMQYYINSFITIENFSEELNMRCKIEAQDNYSWILLRI